MGGKTRKNPRTARKSTACPNPLDKGEKRIKEETVDGLDPEKYPRTDRRCHAPATAPAKPHHHKQWW